MARTRVNLKLVSCERARRIAFKKRKHGLLKKMEEITTLCGIDGCIVIYNPQENDPHVWPSKERAMEMIARYEIMPKLNQDMKKVDHEKFMQHRVDKLREQIERWKQKNMVTQANLIIYQLNRGKLMKDLNIKEIELLCWFSDFKMSEINKQIFLLPPVGLPPHISSKFLSPPQIPSQQPLTLYPILSMDNQNMESFFINPPSYHIQNHPFYMNMFGYGGGSGIGNSARESNKGS